MLKSITKFNSRFIYLFIVTITIVPLLFASLFEKQREEDFLFVLFNSAIILFPLYFIKKYRSYLSIIFPLLFVGALADFIYVILYQGRISDNVFFIIFDSNPQESFEYFESNLNPKLVILCMSYILLVSVLFYKSLKLNQINFKLTWKKYFLFFITLPFLLKYVSSGFDIKKTFEAYRRSSHLLSIIHNYTQYKKEMLYFSSFSSRLRTDFKITRNIKSDNETYLLILGESTTRNKMSLYGYHRKTTPHLDQIKDELVIIKNAYSSGATTITNLKRVLTLAGLEDESREKLSSSLINIMKSAGFQTFWVSNQLILGQHNNATSAFAKQSHKHTFTNTTNGLSYDEKVLPVLKRYLEDPAPKKFIVVHLMGTHMIYRNRYPDEFKQFNSTHDIALKPFHNEEKHDYINAYDNAVLYNDYILKQIIDLFKEKTDYSALFFLSDHGEEVYEHIDFHGHPLDNITKNMFQIPIFFWQSPRYKEKNQWDLSKEKLNNIRYISDDFEHTIFDITNTYPEEFVPEKSYINKKYIERKMPKFIENAKS